MHCVEKKHRQRRSQRRVYLRSRAKPSIHASAQRQQDAKTDSKPHPHLRALARRRYKHKLRHKPKCKVVITRTCEESRDVSTSNYSPREGQPHLLEYAVEKIGAEKILFGTVRALSFRQCFRHKFQAKEPLEIERRGCARFFVTYIYISIFL